MHMCSQRRFYSTPDQMLTATLLPICWPLWRGAPGAVWGGPYVPWHGTADNCHMSMSGAAGPYSTYYQIDMQHTLC